MANPVGTFRELVDGEPIRFRLGLGTVPHPPVDSTILVDVRGGDAFRYMHYDHRVVLREVDVGAWPLDDLDFEMRRRIQVLSGGLPDTLAGGIHLGVR